MKRIIGILLVAALMFILIPKSNTNYEGDQLIFVYRANSGPTSLALDFIHKIVSPKTYSCNLCNVTYGNFSIFDTITKSEAVTYSTTIRGTIFSVV